MSTAKKPEVWKLGDKVPTRYGAGEAVEIDVVSGHGAFAEVVWRMENDERSPDCEARARLIAAAPELLEALQALKKAGGIWPDLVPKVDAAIAKATGSVT